MITLYSESYTYTVLARLRGNARRLVAQCNSGEWRLLVIIDNHREAQRLTPLFMDIRKNKAFTDFVEIFSYKKGICAVFKYCEEVHMRCFEDVIVDAPQNMRSAMLRSLFAKLLAQDIPDFILADVLCRDNLLISPSGDIEFVYDLDFIFDNNVMNAERARAKVMLQLSALVQQIPHGVTLEAFWVLSQRLVCDCDENWTTFYKAANEAADALNRYVPNNPSVPPTICERVFLLRDTILVKLKAITTIALIIAGYIFFLFLFYQIVINPEPVDNGIVEIGTVILQDNKEK